MYRLSIVAAAILSTITFAHADQSTPSGAVEEYNSVLADATSWAEIASVMSSQSIAEIESMDQESRDGHLGFISSIAANKQAFDILDSTVSGDTAEVLAKSCLEQIVTDETYSMVNEGGVWKVEYVNLSQENDPC